MDVVASIPPDVIFKKQSAIAALAPRLQYASPPIELLRLKKDETMWDPPFPDAAEVALIGMFEHAQSLLHSSSRLRPALPHLRNRTKQLMQAEYTNSVYVKVPGEKTVPYQIPTSKAR